MSEARELLSALIDREPVDPATLAELLEDSDNRRLLVELAALRQTLHEPAPGEEEWVTAWRATRRRSTPSPRWRVAAAVLLVAAGLSAGALVERYRATERPPEPSRIVQLEPTSDVSPR